MTLSTWADWAAICSIVIAAVATTFAGCEVFKSRQERKQDLRFLYAKRSVKLSDMLREYYDYLKEIDEQLAFHELSEHHLSLIQELPVRDFLHEAKICASLSKASGISGHNTQLVEFLKILRWMKKEQTSNLKLQSIAGAVRLDSMVWLEGYNRRKALHHEVSSERLFENLFEGLRSSIEDAYEIQS